MMRRFILAVAINLGLCAGLFGSVAAAPAIPPGARLVRTAAEGPYDLRGYGKVAAQGWMFESPSGPLALVRLDCPDVPSAKIVASKYVVDLQSYGAVTPVDCPPGISGTALQVRHGGFWLVGLDGASVCVASAPDAVSLAAAAKAWGAGHWATVPAKAYPQYLDCFDNDSLGMWWMPTTKNAEQMQWFKEDVSVGNLHGQTLQMNPAPGIFDFYGTQNSITHMREAGKPYRYMLWNGSANEGNWINATLLPGEHGEMYPAGAIGGYRFFETGGYNGLQVKSPLVATLMQNALIENLRKRVHEPDLLAWLEPHGEFFLSDPLGVPPGYQTRYPSYLRDVRKYTLESISQAYTGSKTAYTSWDQIPYPDTAYFHGRRGSYLDLDDVAWRWKSGALADGEKLNWNAPGFSDAAWTENFRDDKILLSQQSDDTNVHPLWYRFTHEVSADYLSRHKGQPLYLHIMPYTFRAGRQLSVWVNEQQIAREVSDSTSYYTAHVDMDVSSVLKPGANQFAICSDGGRILYRVFISPIKGEQFPYSDPNLSRRFLDWHDYYIWEKYQSLELYLRTFRSVDPVRPIKVMTPHLFQTESMDLLERYGAYAQLTGEGNWYRPMHYKGYSSLRHMPGSSEPGSNLKTARDIQNMFAMIFWESQDCHDYVFDLNRDFWPYKEVVQWWTDYRPVLKTLGKTDLADPKLGVLRDVRQDQRYDSGLIWNWDISRGALPALGLTPVLIDGPEMENGRADKLPVIVDCATTIMEPAMVDAIRRYVDNGGTFVAQFHTGQHTALQRDAWPLARSYGLKITPKRVTSDNMNKWPLGKIRFAADQTLFPSLRGKETEGSGVAIDYMNNEFTGAVAIEGRGENIKAISNWSDGGMAMAEVRHGKGRILFIGTPFFLRFRDVQGKWLNDGQRQALVEEMLASLGVKRETSPGDERIWFERRDSKNGLYDVYMACAMGVRQKDWTFKDQITGELKALRASASPAIEPTAKGCPDVATTYGNGTLSFGSQNFQPYQVRQFAVVRPDAGLNSPLHWLQVQWRQWRAIEQVPASYADQISAQAARIATDMGEAGLNISEQWKVRINPATPADPSWIAGPVSSAEWIDGGMGTWLSRGWNDATCVQYRRRVDVPQEWRNAKKQIVLGLLGYMQLGVRERGQLWINGKPAAEKLSGNFMLDVTAEAASGSLDLAFQVDSKAVNRGPGGTMYLRATPAPTASIALQDRWRSLLTWETRGEPTTLPLNKKEKIIGLQTTVHIPKEWAGHPIRIVAESIDGNRAGVDGGIINAKGYFRVDSWAPLGPRIDKWLIPGQENDIILLGSGHLAAEAYKGFNPNIKSVRLEVLP